METTANAGAANGRSPGWWYPYIFVAMFGVVVLVNGVLFFMASSTFTGIETEHAFDKGVSYNKAIGAARSQAELGWRTTVTVVPQPAVDQAHGAAVAVEFRDRDGKPINTLGVKAVLLRPTVSGHDQRLDLAWLGDGKYGGTVALPLPGQWDFEVIATHDGATYQLSQRILVP